MRIGLDATPLQGQLTGIGNYLYYLLKELVSIHQEDTFYLYAIRSGPILEEMAREPNVRLRISSWFGFSEALWSQTTLPMLCYRDYLDCFWGTTQSLPLISRKKQINILTIYDFAYLLYPKTVSFVRGAYLRLFAKRFYKKADVRMTISKGTAIRLQNLYGLKADAVVLPPLKTGIVNFQREKELDFCLEKKRYYLMVGTLEPRKNVLLTLRSYCQLLEKKDLDPLVLVGKLGWRNSKIIKEIERLQQRFPKKIRCLGYLPDPTLYHLMQDAKAYLMPSLYEGYGMPIAEARYLGTPVICTYIPEMEEAAEGDAFFLDQQNFCESLQSAFQTNLTAPKKSHYPSAKELAISISDWLYHFQEIKSQIDTV